MWFATIDNMINECSWKGWLGWKRQYKGFWHRTHSAFNARTSIHAACDQETALQFKYCGGIEAEKISFMFLPLIMCPSNKTFGHFSKAIMTIFNWVNRIDQGSKWINIQPLFLDEIVSLWVDPESRSSWTTFGSLNGSLPWRIETSLHIENKPIFDILPR